MKILSFNGVKKVKSYTKQYNLAPTPKTLAKELSFLTDAYKKYGGNETPIHVFTRNNTDSFKPSELNHKTKITTDVYVADAVEGSFLSNFHKASLEFLTMVINKQDNYNDFEKLQKNILSTQRKAEDFILKHRKVEDLRV